MWLMEYSFQSVASGQWKMEIYLFSQRIYKKTIPYSILMSRYKNIAYVPQCSNSPGYMHLKDFDSSSSSFIAQRSSKNQLGAWYLYALVDFFEHA